MRRDLEKRLSSKVFDFDGGSEIDRIAKTIRHQVSRVLKRRGTVLGLSGGVDSSVAAALCVRALGPQRVVGLLLPEEESAERTESLRLGELVAARLGVEAITEDITGILKATGCYERRDRALRKVIPGYGIGWRCKIVLPDLVETDRYRLFSVVAEAPDGTRTRVRLPLAAYLAIVAATNFKQRTRRMLEYYHADRLNYAVVSTPNRLEFDQGFFVKQGDGGGDLKPIAHLYKTQVYALAELLDLPEEIRSRRPTTDTYSLPQDQEEFFFALPYQEMDLCLYALDHGIPVDEAAVAVGLSQKSLDAVFRDIESKRRTAVYGHLPPLLIEEIEPTETLVDAALRNRLEG